MIRVYCEDYLKWYPYRWRWALKNTTEQSQLYMKTRARRCSPKTYKDNDLRPDFTSIEKDADQFNRTEVTWTDIWGLEWEGHRGIFAYAGAPDYQGHLYYYDDKDEWAEDGWLISDEYDAYEGQPPEDIYTCLNTRHGRIWLDTKNIKSVEYHYIVNNHLFKDTYIDIEYEDGAKESIYQDYQKFIDALIRMGKTNCISSLMQKMNEHFEKLKNSDREEERKYYPGKTAEELFLNEAEKRDL